MCGETEASALKLSFRYTSNGYQPDTERKERFMSNDAKSLAHSRWNCKYHLVFTHKYRRKVIYGKLRKGIGVILRKRCERKEVEILETHADAWVDDIGALKTGNYVLGLKMGQNDYQIVGKVLLLELVGDTGKMRGLTDAEVEWIEQNVQIWAKPIGFIE